MFYVVYLLSFFCSVLKEKKNDLKFDTLCGEVNWNLDQITSLKDTKLFSAPANKFIKDLFFGFDGFEVLLLKGNYFKLILKSFRFQLKMNKFLT